MKTPLLLLLAALLTGCVTGNSPESGLKLSASLVGGLNGEIEDEDIDHALGGRIQIRKASKDFPAFDLGLRFGAVQQEVDQRILGLKNTLRGWELNVAPTIRFNIPTGHDSKIRPYVEGFAGYSHFWGREKLDGFGSDRDDGGGLFYGGGLGMEYNLSDRWALHTGLEATWSDWDLSNVDLDQNVISAIVGLTYTF